MPFEDFAEPRETARPATVAEAGSPTLQGTPTIVYGVVREAQIIGDPTFIARAKEIERDLLDMTFALFEAPGIEQRARVLAADMSAASGRPDCLYVADRFGLNREGNIAPDAVAGDQEAFLSGDLAASAEAFAEDVKTSAEELADKAFPWVVIVVAVAVAVIVLKAVK